MNNKYYPQVKSIRSSTTTINLGFPLLTLLIGVSNSLNLLFYIKYW